MSALLSAQNLKVTYQTKGMFQPTNQVHALNGVNLDLQAKEILGIVGESGCGKSTLAKALLKLVPLDSGTFSFRNQQLEKLKSHQFRPLRKKIQLIPQDPQSALIPHLSIYENLKEPFLIFPSNVNIEKEIDKLLDQVSLAKDILSRLPHQISGGQAQRVLIARALAYHPEIIIADEPVSALDLSIQAQILALLKELQQQYNLSIIFISHDFSAVYQLCQRVAVMYRGKVVELGNTQDVIKQSKHPYTQLLIQAVPKAFYQAEQRDRSQYIAKHAQESTEARSIDSNPQGCVFSARCDKASSVCFKKTPKLEDNPLFPQKVACHNV